MVKVLNSNKEFVLDDSFEIQVEDPQTQARSCSREVPKLLRKNLDKMKPVVWIKNTDYLCMARGLMVGKAVFDEEDK